MQYRAWKEPTMQTTTQLCTDGQNPAELVGRPCSPLLGEPACPASCAALEGKGPLRLTLVSPTMPNPGMALCPTSTRVSKYINKRSWDEKWPLPASPPPRGDRAEGQGQGQEEEGEERHRFP